jgi:curved DNA-binding protein CbpA
MRVDGLAGAYVALGLEPGAGPRAARQAFVRAAMDGHPDRGGTVEELETARRAWELVRDEERRRAPARPAETWQARAVRDAYAPDRELPRLVDRFA